MTDYEKLTEIINDIDFLVEHRVTSTAPAFIAWKSNAERFLIYKYGQESFEYFDTIEYAVYHTDRELANYEAFLKEI